MLAARGTERASACLQIALERFSALDLPLEAARATRARIGGARCGGGGGSPCARSVRAPGRGARNDIEMSGVTFSRCRDGRIEEEWELIDVPGLLGQIGAPPETAAG